MQVAQALEAAQARQLIHRDIKPGNIMAVANRTGSLDVKLIDFGLAKGAGSEDLDAARITRTQDFVGSPAFASPEQCEVKKLDIHSDIYSLGVTLWYLLSGKRPFSGSVGEVMVAQIIKPPPFDQLAHIPEPVLELLRRMLAKSPDDRFQTPQEVQDAVERISAGLVSASGAVLERIVAEADSEENKSDKDGVSRKEAPVPVEPVLLATLTSPLFDSYLAVQVGAQVRGRYRLVEEEREGNGGRFFLAQDEKASGGQSSEVGLKLLHPGIVADSALIDLLENEIGVIRQATHQNLVRYLRLERGTPGPFLVREWIHGFLLHDLLRGRRYLNAAELQGLIGPLAATLDFVSDNGLGLVDVSVRKILVACPKDVAREDFQALARGSSMTIQAPRSVDPRMLPPSPPGAPPPKRRLMIGAILCGALIIALAMAIRFGGSGTPSVVTPTPSVRPTATPVVTATPLPSVAIATPTPVPTATPSPAVVATPTPAPTATPSPVVVITPTPASTIPSPSAETTPRMPSTPETKLNPIPVTAPRPTPMPKPRITSAEIYVTGHAEWNSNCQFRAYPTITILQSPANGTVVVRHGPVHVGGHPRWGHTSCTGSTMEGTCIYFRPRPEFHGSDQFTYRVATSQGDNAKLTANVLVP